MYELNTFAIVQAGSIAKQDIFDSVYVLTFLYMFNIVETITAGSLRV